MTRVDALTYVKQLQADVAGAERAVTAKAGADIAAVIKPNAALVTDKVVTAALGEGSMFEPIARAIALDGAIRFSGGFGSMSSALAALAAKIEKNDNASHREQVDGFISDYHGDGAAARAVGIELRGDYTQAKALSVKLSENAFRDPKGAEYSFRFDDIDTKNFYAGATIGRLADSTWVISGDAYMRMGHEARPPDYPLTDANLASLESIERALVGFIASKPKPSPLMAGLGAVHPSDITACAEAESLLVAVRAAIADKNGEIAAEAQRVSDQIVAGLQPSVGWVSPDLLRAVERLDRVATAAPANNGASKFAIVDAHEMIRKGLAENDAKTIRDGIRALNVPSQRQVQAIEASERPSICTTLVEAIGSSAPAAHVVSEMMRRLNEAPITRGDEAGQLLVVLQRAIESTKAAPQREAVAQGIIHELGSLVLPRNRRDGKADPKYKVDESHNYQALADIVSVAATGPDDGLNARAILFATENMGRRATPAPICKQLTDAAALLRKSGQNALADSVERVAR